MSPGAENVVRAASGLSSRLPWPLGVLARLAYDGANGWALPGEADDDHHARHADERYRLLEREVVPEFYARDDAGIPQVWIERVKRSMRTLIPAFSATRILAEYESRVYRAA